MLVKTCCGRRFRPVQVAAKIWQLHEDIMPAEEKQRTAHAEAAAAAEAVTAKKYATFRRCLASCCGRRMLRLVSAQAYCLTRSSPTCSALVYPMLAPCLRASASLLQRGRVR